MIRIIWVQWILIFLFTTRVISVFFKAAGYESKTTWDADLSSRLIGIVVNIGIAVVFAIALGWI